MNGWIVDLATREAHHRSGVTLRFRPAGDGAWDGEAIAGLDRVDPESAARLMREAGDAYMAAIREARRQALIELGRALYGERWQRELGRAIRWDDRAIRRCIAGEMPVPRHRLDAARALAERRRDDLATAVAGAAAVP